MVMARGAGSGLGSAVAAERAERGLHENAELMLALHPCPRCGGRHLAALAWSLGKVALVMLFVLLVSTALYACTHRSRDLPIALWTDGILFAAICAFALVEHVRELRRAPTAVVFPAAATAQTAPPA